MGPVRKSLQVPPAAGGRLGEGAARVPGMRQREAVPADQPVAIHVEVAEGIVVLGAEHRRRPEPRVGLQTRVPPPNPEGSTDTEPRALPQARQTHEVDTYETNKHYAVDKPRQHEHGDVVVQILASWHSPLTRRYPRESKSE